MHSPRELENMFVGAVTVGERGQVVIPAEAREQMSLEPGDKLLVFLHPSGQLVSLCKVTMIEQVVRALSRLQAMMNAEADDDSEAQ